MKKELFILFFAFAPMLLVAQADSTRTKLSFNGDFRFRVEQDWQSRKSDGTYRDDRTRLRYRARFGGKYQFKEWMTVGMGIRTGDPRKQQDPQLTLGDGFKEFNTLPIGFEKIYAAFGHKWFSGWVGKNIFPFEKQNELFWSDNVFPEGVSLSATHTFENKFIQRININTGHFILGSNGTSLGLDSYFQGIQLVTTHWENRIKLFPGFYSFHKIPDIPDGNETFTIDYTIFHLGAKIDLIKNPKVQVGIDHYKNIKNLVGNDSIPQKFRNQNKGFVTSMSIGDLKKAGDFKLGLTYTYLERFSAVDFLAQNDWTRWDYSSQGSPDGRLTNFKGFEIMIGYAIAKNMDLQFRGFRVDQIIPTGLAKETGNRARLDFNIRF